MVSIISSFQDYNDLALGSIVGSNISNIGLVLAVSTFIFYYVLGTNIVPQKGANHDSYVMVYAVILLFFFAMDNVEIDLLGDKINGYHKIYDDL